MYPCRLILFLLLWLSGVCATAQTLKGVIRSAETRESLYPAVVTNMKTSKTVYTDDQGRFTLTASAGDDIAIYFVGHVTRQWVMPSALGIHEETFFLQPINHQLREVVVRTKNYTQYQIDSMERRSVYQRALAREKGGSVTSPFTFVAEKLSTKSRQIYKFQKDFKYWETQKYIDVRYNPDIVNQLTNLTGDTLAYFMNAYPMPYDYARTATDLEFKMWIRNNFKAWMKRQADTVGTTKKEH